MSDSHESPNLEDLTPEEANRIIHSHRKVRYGKWVFPLLSCHHRQLHHDYPLSTFWISCNLVSFSLLRLWYHGRIAPNLPHASGSGPSSPVLMSVTMTSRHAPQLWF